MPTEDTSEITRMQTWRLVTDLRFDAIPEMSAPTCTITTPAQNGYARALDMRPDAPFFNASTYCNRLNIRLAEWLRHPATISLLNSFKDYYRDAAREVEPCFIMLVKSGPRCVHGYYVHIMLHDALSAWCDRALHPEYERPRIPLPDVRTVPIGSSRSSPTTSTTTNVQLAAPLYFPGGGASSGQLQSPPRSGTTTTVVVTRRTVTTEEQQTPTSTSYRSSTVRTPAA